MAFGPSLTELYLHRIRSGGFTAAELLPPTRVPPVIESFYRHRCLARPLFFDHGEHTRLVGDLAAVHEALVRLPDLLFGGDLAAFARAVGLSEAETELVVRTQSGRPVTRYGRADIYADETGPKLLEYNIGSTVGLVEAGLLNEALLEHPVLASFAAEHGLGFPDMVGQCLASLRLEVGLPPDSTPTVAMVFWPEDFPENEEPLRRCADLHRRHYGVDTVPLHLGQLTYRDGRVWADGRAVDVIYRCFLLQHAATPAGRELVEPLLAAVERGEVRMFTPLGCQVYSSKAALALLSQHAGLFEPELRERLRRFVPWTRRCRPGEVELDTGMVADLREHAIEQRAELTLKPAFRHGGSGVLPGWETPPDEWAARVDEALAGGWVLQRRVHPQPQLVPAPDGTLTPYTLNLGVFSMPAAPAGYGGTALRAAPVARNVAVLGIYTDPSVLLGCAMHQLAPAQ
ncbi:glutathionylspermidine synthase family protein [Catellatospora tritici]|uniref:glutathionylspermidine synthase family protein n=1 Tax=Catellatospora tritici TaxID=2851566 RepID=UPI001C2CEBB2|nr:glutathionylspermidine synthase family protein [Catellatospora tritici]MBV1856212.1 glutathionylspermidine synthase family protein [Catellatospora tritici]